MCQVLYVPPRGKRAQLALYVRFTARGKVKTVTTAIPPRSRAPWIRIYRKEYKRLYAFYLRRPRLSEAERHAHRQESYQRYREHIARIRTESGLPLTGIALGHRAPEAMVQEVLALVGQINPDTGKPFTGVEIALRTRLSASSVSRIRNGKRHHIHAANGRPDANLQDQAE